MTVIFISENCNIGKMIQAKDVEVGCSYKTATGIEVCVLSKIKDNIFVKSNRTGNTIKLSQDYPFKEKIENKNVEEKMTEQTNPTAEPTAPALNKEKRGKKSAIIDEALKQEGTTDEIVQKVLAVYPDLPEKNVRNLVSVRRTKLKKQTQTK